MNIEQQQYVQAMKQVLEDLQQFQPATHQEALQADQFSEIITRSKWVNLRQKFR
jgi:hemerythrin superfamily protein